MSSIGLGDRIRLQNVMLATDFSEASDAAVGYAASIARNYQGKVYAVHVIPPEVYWWVSPEALPKVEDGVEECARQQMKALLASEQLRDVAHEGVVKHGEIWDGLQLLISQHNADVIVAGTRGRRGLQKLVMGSVAEEILRLSPIPVLTVRPRRSAVRPSRNPHSAVPNRFLRRVDARSGICTLDCARIPVIHDSPARCSFDA